MDVTRGEAGDGATDAAAAVALGADMWPAAALVSVLGAADAVRLGVPNTWA